MTSVESPPVKQRIKWVDVARGMAAFAVVVMHVQDGLANDGYGQLPLSHIFLGLGDSVRMQTMMFVAGIFAIPALRKGAPDFIAGKLSKIAWPFLLWSVIYYYLWQLAGRIEPNPLTIFVPIKLMIKTTLHMWFLQYLLIFFAFTLFFVGPQPSYRKIVTVGTLICTPALVFGSIDPSYFGPEFRAFIEKYVADDYNNLAMKISRLGSLFIFFLMGIGANKFGISNLDKILKFKSTLLSIALLTIAATVMLMLPIRKYYIESVPVSIIGVIGFLFAAEAINRLTVIREFFVRLSVNAIEIYILHLGIALLVRRALGHLGVQNLLLQVIVGIIATLAICLIIATAFNRLNMRFLFALPIPAITDIKSKARITTS